MYSSNVTTGGSYTTGCPGNCHACQQTTAPNNYQFCPLMVPMEQEAYIPITTYVCRGCGKNHGEGHELWCYYNRDWRGP